MRDGQSISNSTTATVGRSEPLNRIDCAILAELAAGYPQAVAARRLGMSTRTIRRRLNAICKRIGARSPIQAVAWAARRQMI